MATARQTIGLFWRHAKKYPIYIWGLAVTVPLSVIVGQFLPPLIVSDILTRLTNGHFVAGDLWTSFGGELIVYAILAVLSGVVLWRISIILIWRLEMRVMRDMAQRVFNHLMQQSAHFHANRFGGSLVSQANKLLGSYIRVADTTTFDIFTMIIAFAATFIILVPRAPIVAAVLGVISVFYMVGAYLFSKPVQRRTALKAEQENKQTGNLADSITNVMAVKSFAAEGYENQRFADTTEVTRTMTVGQMKAEIIRDTYSSSITTAIDITALFVGIISVVSFGGDPATVFLVVTYTRNLTQRLWEFSSHVLRNYTRAMGDAESMVEILNTTPDLQDPEQPEESRIKDGKIEFKNVVFAHNDSPEALFNGLSLTVKPGEKIGLVGHSGSGKTTLTKVLLRYSDIQDGEVLVDGQNIANITQNDLRRNIAYVPQEPLLFHRTLRENIAYGKFDATDDEIFAASKRAHADDFIKKLSQGYDTLVGERGVKLSGGQRQRVAIARAMIKDAPILVLDEATSALDSESEKLIQSALWELMEGRTAIVIAHRLSTIQRMDRILVMEDGKIVEQGNHKDLLAKKNGVYAELWKHQSGGFIEE